MKPRIRKTRPGDHGYKYHDTLPWLLEDTVHFPEVGLVRGGCLCHTWEECIYYLYMFAGWRRDEQTRVV